MKLDELLKQAQPGMAMDPAMMGMDPAMMGAPPPDMSSPPPAPGPPQAPTPEELMMALGGGQMGAMPQDMMAAPPDNKDIIIEKQVEVIDNLSDTVNKMVDMNTASGNSAEDAADNIAASLVGSGLLDGMPVEELPPVEEEPPAI